MAKYRIIIHFPILYCVVNNVRNLLLNMFHVQDDRCRLMRRTIMRYVNLSYVMILSMVSVRVKKRFPTLDHLVEAGNFYFLLSHPTRVIICHQNVSPYIELFSVQNYYSCEKSRNLNVKICLVNYLTANLSNVEGCCRHCTGCYASAFEKSNKKKPWTV